MVPIGEIDSDLAAMAEAKEEKLNILANTCNAHLARIIENIRVDLLLNPFAILKTNKNATEQWGIRKSHIRDAFAVIDYFS